jgi:hypothetical protein
VAEIWKELKKENGIKLNQGWVGSPRSWLFDFLLSCTKREATILAIAFWHIWEARNTVRNGEAEIHPRCWVEKNPNICGYGFVTPFSLLFLQKVRDHQVVSLDSTTGGVGYDQC